jgi:predicted Zn-dependent protease
VVKLFQATCSLVKNTMIFQVSGQILLSNLPIGEKYKYFLKVVKLFHMTSPLVKNAKISQFPGDLLDGEKYKDFLEMV